MRQENYSEEGNTPMQKITVGDLLGESGKFTPAELADKVRKKYKVKENPRELIEEATNVENARSRCGSFRDHNEASGRHI
jgi:hypothetical protein